MAADQGFEDEFEGSFIDLRTKQGFGQYAEYLVESGKYCKIRVLYDPELYPDNAPSILRKRELSAIIE